MSFIKLVSKGLVVALSFNMLCAFGDDSPPSSINSVKMATTIAKHYAEYMRWHPIGMCVWMHWSMFGPYYTYTLELDEYLPDLVVTVFNENGDDPWTETKVSFDKLSQALGNTTIRAVTGDELTDGHNTSTRGEMNNNSVITKSVDVIGSPMSLLNIPYVTLRADTTGYMPYYQSGVDAVPGRLGIAEALRKETWNPMGNYIGGSFINHWAYEFPRDMSVDNNNDFKASVSVALHAADIVTNRNTLHVVNSTADSCGRNCSVANVIEENADEHEIWEEVYPTDKHIQLGQSDTSSATPLGQEDEKQGHGNYVYVIWRHYRGCMQDDGMYVTATVTVPPTVKR